MEEIKCKCGAVIGEKDNQGTLHMKIPNECKCGQSFGSKNIISDPYWSQNHDISEFPPIQLYHRITDADMYAVAGRLLVLRMSESRKITPEEMKKIVETSAGIAKDLAKQWEQ